MGQWVAYGGAEPTVTNGSFAFPSGGQIAGYFYTQFPTAPQVGQTLTLNYTVTANNPVWVQAPYGAGATDTNPPTLHLFVWRRGDDLSCQGNYADYRLFAGRTALVPGAGQTISIPLTTISWTGCYGKNPVNIQDELSNLLGAGFTFGGQSFAGHGIYLSSGSATFTINSFKVQ